MARGVAAAKAVQKRLATEKRIEPADFRDALQRFQTEGRDIVAALEKQITGSLLSQNVELAKKAIARANDMIDLAVGVVTTSAELANEFIQANSTKSHVAARRKRRR